MVEADSLSSTEAALREVWSRVFRRPVEPQDDFFKLGGDSLLALHVLMLSEGAVGARIPLAELFEYPVLRDFAGRVNAALGVSRHVAGMSEGVI